MISVNLKCVKLQHLHILKSITKPLSTHRGYYASVMVTPTHPQLYLIRKCVELEAMGLYTPYKSPLRHGDSELDDISINVQNLKQPIILNADGSVADIEQRVAGVVEGDYFDVTITAFSYSNDHSRGVAFGITHIKFRKQ